MQLRKRFKTSLKDFIVNGIAASNLCPRVLRILIYKIPIFKININTFGIRGGCFFGGNSIIEINKGTFINSNCFFEGTAKTIIGKNCALGMSVYLINSDHDYSNPLKRAGNVKGKSIIIGDGCWIGANVTILPGVKIGEGCVIAAGSVVTNNCEAHKLYGGIPAKKIKDLYC